METALRWLDEIAERMRDNLSITVGMAAVCLVCCCGCCVLGFCYGRCKRSKGRRQSERLQGGNTSPPSHYRRPFDERSSSADSIDVAHTHAGGVHSAHAPRRPAPPMGNLQNLHAAESEVQISITRADVATGVPDSAAHVSSVPPGAPLPPPAPFDDDEWAGAQTEEGETYYYHLVTGETVWDRPGSVA